MRRVSLPDHTSVWAFSRFEARLVYREIVTDRTYELHGITLPPGAAVFDVGANIGLYAIRLARTVPDVRVRCYEPLPPTFSALEQNLAEHAPAATAVRAGLGAVAGTTTFDFDRFSSITSTMSPADVSRAADRSASFAQWASAALADVERVEPGGVISLARWLSNPAGRPAVIGALGVLAACLTSASASSSRAEQCEIRTIRPNWRHAASTISTVKTTSKAARKVCSTVLPMRTGVASANSSSKCTTSRPAARIAAELQRRGYQVTHDREDWAAARADEISTLYATRPGEVVSVTSRRGGNEIAVGRRRRRG